VLPDGLQQLQGVFLDTLLHEILLPSEPPPPPGALLAPPEHLPLPLPLARASLLLGLTPC
jgi:hypothetical protein